MRGNQQTDLGLQGLGLNFDFTVNEPVCQMEGWCSLGSPDTEPEPPSGAEPRPALTSSLTGGEAGQVLPGGWCEKR